MVIEEVAEIGIEALRQAKKVHDELGENGLTPVPSPNQFGEQALLADVLCEKAILDTLRVAHFPIRVTSEEHGTTYITEEPIFSGTADGLDGTVIYKKGPGIGRYGTMFGIASGLNPRYEDYLFSGIMEHASNMLWIATKGQGSYLISENDKTKIIASQKSVFDESARIYTGENYNELSRKIFAGKFPFNWKKEPLSAAIEYVDIASGEAELEVEVTRKGNLEQMIAYGLLKEAGADMYTFNGENIGGQKYLEFGQSEFIPIFSAANP